VLGLQCWESGGARTVLRCFEARAGEADGARTGLRCREAIGARTVLQCWEARAGEADGARAGLWCGQDWA
jgi:hypothetical protein